MEPKKYTEEEIRQIIGERLAKKEDFPEATFITIFERLVRHNPGLVTNLEDGGEVFDLALVYAITDEVVQVEVSKKSKGNLPMKPTINLTTFKR